MNHWTLKFLAGRRVSARMAQDAAGLAVAGHPVIRRVISI
jgi:hypothetical protein